MCYNWMMVVSKALCLKRLQWRAMPPHMGVTMVAMVTMAVTHLSRHRHLHRRQRLIPVMPMIPYAMVTGSHCWSRTSHQAVRLRSMTKGKNSRSRKSKSSKGIMKNPWRHQLDYMTLRSPILVMLNLLTIKQRIMHYSSVRRMKLPIQEATVDQTPLKRLLPKSRTRTRLSYQAKYLRKRIVGWKQRLITVRRFMLEIHLCKGLCPFHRAHNQDHNPRHQKPHRSHKPP